MKVWELEEGKEYIVINMYSIMACEKYRIKNGILESFSYGEWGGSSWDNRIDILKELNFTEYTPPIDWSKVEVDTKVLVRDFDNNVWSKRYFAEYKDGEYYAYADGKTSWSSDGDETQWNQMKLYTEE